MRGHEGEEGDKMRTKNIQEAVGVYLLLVTVPNTRRFNLVMPQSLDPSLSHGLAAYETGRQLGRVKWKLFRKRKALLVYINSHVATCPVCGTDSNGF